MSALAQKIEKLLEELEDVITLEEYIDNQEEAEDLIERIQKHWQYMDDEEKDYTVYARNVIYGEIDPEDSIPEPSELDEWHDFDPDC